MLWSVFSNDKTNQVHRVTFRPRAGRASAVALGFGILVSLSLSGAEVNLATLRVGGVVYSNVTVTTVTATTILFNHSQGMGSAKLEALPPELQKRFGFDAAKAGAARRQERDAEEEFRVRTLRLLRDSEAGPAIEGLPFHAVPIATAEVKLRMKIRTESDEMLRAANFDGLDERARTYRAGRETFPDGTWLLGEVYNGLESDDRQADQTWRDRIAVLRDWTNARPESITARVALANEMVSYGWKARGTGYRDDVPQSQFRLFIARAECAMMLSQEAATLKEKCPFTPIPMLIATRGISARPERFLNPLVDAMKAEPNFMYYYEEGVIYELPRWHGTAEWSAELFLKRHADEIGGEEGDVLYARIAWLMQTSGMFSNAIKECGFSSDRVEKGFQALERRYPDALSVKSMHALLGGFVGGREVARGLIDKLDGKVDLSIWTVDQFKEQVRFAYALEKQKPVAPTQVAGPVKKS